MKKLLLFMFLCFYSCGISNEDIGMKIVKGEGIEAEEKIQFVKFINSNEGKKWMSNLKNRVNSEIKDGLQRRRALMNISKVERTALEWENLSNTSN